MEYMEVEYAFTKKIRRGPRQSVGEIGNQNGLKLSQICVNHFVQFTTKRLNCTRIWRLLITLPVLTISIKIRPCYSGWGKREAGRGVWDCMPAVLIPVHRCTAFAVEQPEWLRMCIYTHCPLRSDSPHAGTITLIINTRPLKNAFKIT